MKICVSSLQEHKDYELHEKVHFDKEKYQTVYIRDISDVDVNAYYRIDGDFLTVSVKVKGEATLACAYTLEDVKHKFTFSDDIVFSDNKDNEDGDTIIYDRNEIVLDDFLLSLVVASLPLKVVKKGLDKDKAKFMSEEEYEEKRKKSASSPFDVLSDLDLD